MTFFRASTHIEDGDLTVRLNNIVIAENTGLFEKEIDKGNYVVQWFVAGRVDSTYFITISSPKGAEFQLTRTIGRSGRDYGGFHFST